ncbi:MAG: ankyrin repeat domain-containing protein, partial [Pseudomonadota bacterium]
ATGVFNIRVLKPAPCSLSVTLEILSFDESQKPLSFSIDVKAASAEQPFYKPVDKSSKNLDEHILGSQSSLQKKDLTNTGSLREYKLQQLNKNKALQNLSFARTQRSKHRRAIRIKGSRTALASGLIVGIIAAGLAISVSNPKIATRVAYSLERDARKILPESDLIKAVRSRNALEVKGLLDNGADANVRDKSGKPALLLAADLNDLSSVSFLLRAGADPTLDSGNGRSVMHQLAIEGQARVLERIVKLGLPIEVPGGSQGCWTPLAAAIAYEKKEIVELLARYGASFDPQPGCATGPLDIAEGLPKIQAQLARITVERMESVMELGGTGKASGNPLFKDQVIIDHGQKIAGLTPIKGNTTIFADFAGGVERAVRDKNLNKLRELIEERPEGVDLAHIRLEHSENFDGKRLNLVDFVALERQWEMTKHLVSAGLRPSIQAIHFSIDHSTDRRYQGLLAHLLQNGADPNAIYQNYTPLMRAAALNRDHEVRTLLAAGADPKIKNEDQQVAAYFAALAGNHELQEMLVLAAYESDYDTLLMGLSWRDTYLSIKDKLGECRELANDFLACKLKSNRWLELSPVNIVLQFDQLADQALVAIQVDSFLINDPDQARFVFDKTVEKIEKILPASQKGFVNRQETQGIPLFEGLMETTQMA